MIDRVERLIRSTRRFVSRSEWAVRLLGLPRFDDTADEHGLVLIQLDGLAEAEVRDALKAGRMPFLQHLLDDEHYRLVPFYSGLPSTTPAVQGELFYGVKQAVPAFSFLDRSTGRIVRMYEHDPTADVEARLRKHQGLLDEGSAYTDIYAGGASDSRFCAASGAVTDLARARYPLALPFLAIANFFSILKIIALLPIELVLAAGGLVRGVINGHDFLAELKFIPSRIFVCILLRELVTIGAKVDIARGVPVIHLNYLAYDEQAHRRGPSSPLAHWSLKGLDDSIKRLVHAAHRSGARRYDVWVYSDHGQEKTTPYVQKHGRFVQDAVADVFKELGIESQPSGEPKHGVQRQRARVFGEWIARKLLAGADVGGQWLESGTLFTAAMGPLGHIYAPRALTTAERDEIAQRLVEEAGIPLVLAPGPENTAHAWTRHGRFELPKDNGQILGEDHPYLSAVTQDLLSLCRHTNAGDLIISGWQPDDTPLSFPIENGAHAGPGPRETAPFMILPEDIILPDKGDEPLRPIDLREAALQFLGRKQAEQRPPATPSETQKSLRVMTYNVHSCVGMDGKLSPRRIARVIDLYKPDIVALQELDMHRPRTGGMDQAHLIAQELRMTYHFHPTIQVEEEKYGDAVLSRHPMRVVRAEEIPRLNGRAALEPRGAIWVEVEVNGHTVQLLNTHLSLHPRERRLQAEALMGPEWAGHSDFSGTRLFCGDLNAGPNSPTYREIVATLSDVQSEGPAETPEPTFFSRYPVARIDHVFVGAETKVTDTKIPSTRLTRAASDHLPLIVEIAIPGR